MRRDESDPRLFGSLQRWIGRPANFKVLKFRVRGDLPHSVLNVARCLGALRVGRSTPSLGPGSTRVCAPASLSRDRCGALWINTYLGRPTPLVGAWLDQVCLSGHP